MNTKQNKQRAQLVTVLSLMALVAVLSYTFAHTGSLLARYIRPEMLGYVAAAGVELTVIAMSLQFNLLGDKGKSLGSKSLFLFVFVATLTVSALANVSEGFRVSMSMELTSVTFKQVDPVVAIIGVSATGLLSLVTMSLAELLGDSFGVVSGIVTNLADAARQSSKDIAPGDTMDAGRQKAIDTQRASKTEAINALVDILRDNPNTTKTELAQQVGKSRATVNNYLAELTDQGVIERNGSGVQVTQ